MKICDSPMGCLAFLLFIVNGISLWRNEVNKRKLRIARQELENEKISSEVDNMPIDILLHKTNIRLREELSERHEDD